MSHQWVVALMTVTLLVVFGAVLWALLPYLTALVLFTSLGVGR